MKHKGAMLAGIMGVLLLSGVLGSSLYTAGPTAGSGEGPTGLVRPALARAAEQTFLEKEAGITAYVNLGRAIDLAAVKAKFRTVEKETADYIVGSVGLPGYSSSEDVHVFVTKDGWVAAYYGKDEPVSKIVDWKNYSKGGSTLPNKLSLGLTQLPLTIPQAALAYYHFAFATANRLYLVADSDSFYVTIPREFTVWERSYGLLGNIVSCQGRLTAEQLLPDVRHGLRYQWEAPGFMGNYKKVALYVDNSRVGECPTDSSWGHLSAFFALALVYTES